jgi:hypothetical protein
MHDAYAVLKVRDLITCLSVKFLLTLLKYVWPDDDFVLTRRNMKLFNLQLVLLFTMLLKRTFTFTLT